MSELGLGGTLLSHAYTWLKWFSALRCLNMAEAVFYFKIPEHYLGSNLFSDALTWQSGILLSGVCLRLLAVLFSDA